MGDDKVRTPADDSDEQWEKAKPRSRIRDKHGREELLVHPHLKTQPAPHRLVESTQPRPGG